MDENLANNSMVLKHHRYFSREFQALKTVMGVCCVSENHVTALWEEDGDVVHVLHFLGGLLQLAKGEGGEVAGILLDSVAVHVVYNDADKEEAGMFQQVSGRKLGLFRFFQKGHSTKI